RFLPGRPPAHLLAEGHSPAAAVELPVALLGRGLLDEADLLEFLDRRLERTPDLGVVVVAAHPQVLEGERLQVEVKPQSVGLDQVLVEVAVESPGRLMPELAIELVIKLLQVARAEAVEETALPAHPRE